MSIFWRPYLPLLLVLNSIYILYPYIRFGKAPETLLTDFAASFHGAVISSHSETHVPKTNVLYLSVIPIIYLPPNEPNVLLQRQIENIRTEDCWLMKGSKGYVEIDFKKAVKMHHFVYHHFNQSELFVSTPKIIKVEAMTNNDTLIHMGTFNTFCNVTQRNEHKVCCFLLYTFTGLQLQNHTVLTRLRLHVLQNHGNPIYTTLCRFQLFGQEEKMRKDPAAKM